MGIMKNVLGWIERTARYWRGGDDNAPRRRGRHGTGSYIMAGGLMSGGQGMGYPGGWLHDRVEQVAHYRHWTYRAVDSICKEIAGLTPRVALVDAQADPYQRQFNATSKRYQKSLQAIADHEEITDVGNNHPLVRLLQCPNEWDVACDLWYKLIMFLELTGNGYLWLVPNGFGLPAEIWVIPSHWVWNRMGPGGVKWYEVRPFLGPGFFKFPPEEIIHVKYPSPIHPIDGWSPQQAGSEWIDAAESVDRSRFFQFRNGCFPIGNLELGAEYNDPDDADLERIYAKFFSRIQGEQNYGRPIITPPGAKYVPLTINPAEMAYVESADQLRDWVLALYGVPKEIAGIQDAGSEIAMYGPLIQFTQRTIAPKLRYLSQVLTRWLAARYDPCLRLWWDDPAPVSPEQVNRDLAIDAANGWIMPNEGRAVRGRRPYTPEEEEKYANPSTTTPKGARPEPAAGTSGQNAPSMGRMLPLPERGNLNGNHTK